MSATKIDAMTLSRMFLAGAKNLEGQKEYINELNVFPVPDGDTGTNMSMTIMSAVNEVNHIEKVNMKTLCKAISSGSLRGARGNSGVILSQLLRGFTKAIADLDVLEEVDIAAGFTKAVETAYKAVMKPKEGTILTVAREVAEKANELALESESIEQFMEALIAEGEASLNRTPDLLPVLKEAGVVDSGGMGLMMFFKGAYDGYTGKTTEFDFSDQPKAAPISSGASRKEVSEEDIKFGYCTEFIILLNKTLTEEEEVSFKEYLLGLGDSLVFVADDEILKVHVHTNHPGLAFEKALTFGELTRMKIDNMREEHRETLFRAAEEAAAREAAEAKKKEQMPHKEFGFITISVGDGFTEIFNDLGVDRVITGGQTMNPSTDDILSAIEEINADHIFVLPNNKNIILAANQAKDLTEDKDVIVIPTKTVPQGIAAMLGYVPDSSLEENTDSMNEAIGTVSTISVTYAVRDTQIDGKDIHEGDIMAIGDAGLLAVGTEKEAVAAEAVKAVSDDASMISIYYGADADEDSASGLSSMIEEACEDAEVEVYNGGQPIYYYIISAE